MKKTLASGATLEITRSPFVISHKLFKTVVRELKEGVDLKIGLKEGQSLSKLTDMDLSDEAINTVKDAILTLLSSEEIEAVLWECMPRVTYNNQKITRELFDDEKAVVDYLEIVKEVAIFNLTPFGKSLASLFPGKLGRKFTSALK